LVIELAPALRRAQADATAVLTVPPGKDDPPPKIPDPTVTPKGRKVVREASREGLTITEAKAVLQDIEGELQEGRSVDISYRVLDHD
jgi:hypothetical protein